MVHNTQTKLRKKAFTLRVKLMMPKDMEQYTIGWKKHLNLCHPKPKLPTVQEESENEDKTQITTT